MNPVREIRAAEPRPLPVVILADVSGSMSEDGKIEALNLSVRNLIEALAEEQDTRGAVHVAVITFGMDSAKLHVPLTPASGLRWNDMAAQGRTPMGAAIRLLRDLVENEAAVPRRAFTPTVVLVSDGRPTDDWKEALAELQASERARKTLRMAMAIGADADLELLRDFVGPGGAPVFQAEDAREIRKFFRWVTMSVAARSRSANPNADPHVSPDDDFEL